MEETDARLPESLRAAQLYYLQHLTMDAIAKELAVSRSTVSRLLQYARDTGLVEITVHSGHGSRDVLTQRLRTQFGINPHIVTVPPRISENERLDRVSRAAAQLVARRMDSHQVVGIAWGATLAAVGRHLPHRPVQSHLVVQMNGAANEQTSGISYAGEILTKFHGAFGSRTQPFPVPALFDDPETRRALWRERSVQRVLAAQRSADVFVFGLGSPRAHIPSHVYSGDYFSQDDLLTLARTGVVGDCATRFYRIDGSSDQISLNERSSGPDFDVVRSIPQRICVVAGASKLESVRGGLEAGLITDLVLDEGLAKSLLTAE